MLEWVTSGFPSEACEENTLELPGERERGIEDDDRGMEMVANRVDEGDGSSDLCETVCTFML